MKRRKRGKYLGINKQSKYKQGLFKPSNPEKYKGNVKNIVYRSSWELKLLFRFDRDDNIIKYSSEEVVIPYKSPKDNRYHRYYMDFWIKKKDGTECLIEVKPKIQTMPPKKGRKKETTYLNEVVTYQVNQAKWEAADKYAKKRGMEFVIMTEEEIL